LAPPKFLGWLRHWLVHSLKGSSLFVYSEKTLQNDLIFLRATNRYCVLPQCLHRSAVKIAGRLRLT